MNELKAQLAQELDFRREAGNARALAAAFAHNSRVLVPEVFPALSGERVLTMAWVDGCKVGLGYVLPFCCSHPASG